jgi:hypothetical protein
VIRLFTTYYAEKNEERRKEYETCLLANLSCLPIGQICILDENSKSTIEDCRILRQQVSRRPTYQDFFTWINEVASHSDYSIIANSDIAFTPSISTIKIFDWEKRPLCLSLSRWDVDTSGTAKLFEHGDSQDAWVFKGKVCGVKSNFPLGVYDCDNKIAWELEQAGYHVINPCYAVRTYHHHQCGFRSYETTPPPDYGIRPPFRYVEPDNYWGPLKAWHIKRELRLSYFPWMMTRQRFWRYPLPKLAIRVWNKIMNTLRLASGKTPIQVPKSS